MNVLLTVKAFHIIFVVSWFCGLFYIVRLFVYHREVLDKPEPEKSFLAKEYRRIERLLWKIITMPAMLGTVITGLLMIYLMPSYIYQPWMQVKLVMVFFLLVYHFLCGRIFNKLKSDNLKMSSFQLRLWNEVATIFLVMIVFVVVQKQALDWIYGLLFFIAFAVFIMSAVRIVKSFRKRS